MQKDLVRIGTVGINSTSLSAKVVGAFALRAFSASAIPRQ